MVRRNVQQHGNIGTEVIHIVQLERRELDDVVFMGFFCHLQSQRVADVASQSCVIASSLEYMIDEARCGGLSIGARDANHLRRGVAACKLYLADDGNACLDSLGDHRSRIGDARTLDNLVGIEDEALRMLSFLPGNAAFVEHLLIAWSYLRHVTHKHVETFFLRQHSSTGSAFSCSKYYDSFHFILSSM